jgi:uncharacterized protein
MKKLTFLILVLINTAFCQDIKKLRPRDSSIEKPKVNFNLPEKSTPRGNTLESYSDSVVIFPWTTDFERVFTKTEIEYLDSMISDFEHTTKAEIKIFTFDSSMVTKSEFDSLINLIPFTLKVDTNHIQNGIVIGLSKGLRTIRIKTGVVIQAVLTDEETKLIIDQNMIPEFKEGRYFLGTVKGLSEIMKKIR